MKKIILPSLFVLIFAFQSAAHVQLLNPIGGESFTPGSQIKIEWREVIAHASLNWDILFSSDGGVTWDTVKSDIPLATLDYNWIIPDISTTQGRIKIVQDNVAMDYEDISKNFTVLSTVTGIESPIETNKINVYPNPLINYATIEYDNSGHYLYKLAVYDTKGQLVRSIIDIKTNKIEFERKDLSRGLYILKLSSNTRPSYVGRFIIK